MQQDNPHKEQPKKREEESTPIYLTDNSTLQTPEEHKLDKSKKPGKEEHIEASSLEDTPIDELAGSDKAGTSERKP